MHLSTSGAATRGRWSTHSPGSLRRALAARESALPCIPTSGLSRVRAKGAGTGGSAPLLWHPQPTEPTPSLFQGRHMHASAAYVLLT